MEKLLCQRYLRARLPSKIFTIAAALEEGIISGNETFFCDGGQDVAGTYIRCVNRVGGMET